MYQSKFVAKRLINYNVAKNDVLYGLPKNNDFRVRFYETNKKIDPLKRNKR